MGILAFIHEEIRVKARRVEDYTNLSWGKAVITFAGEGNGFLAKKVSRKQKPVVRWLNTRKYGQNLTRQVHALLGGVLLACTFG